MFLPGKAGFFALTLLAASILLAPNAAQATNTTLQGLFTRDDSVQFFNLTVATAGPVDIRSYGYAGGTTSTGVAVPRAQASG